MEEFKLGDRVFSPHFGFGIVETVFKNVLNHPYPVVVRWEQEEGRAIEPNTLDYYTLDGKYDTEDSVSDYNIVNMGRNILPKEYEEDERLEHVSQKSVSDDEEIEDEDTENMEDPISYSAINPKHYKVEGLPEAIDIMNHLMTPEQFEGFLWGNIMKYAYRFGRKGDKAETAGKIAWYANQLKAAEEWRKENET